MKTLGEAAPALEAAASASADRMTATFARETMALNKWGKEARDGLSRHGSM